MYCAHVLLRRLLPFWGNGRIKLWDKQEIILGGRVGICEKGFMPFLLLFVDDSATGAGA